MCFSAAASFTAGVVLLGVGVLTLRAARRPRELPLAAIPMLFAIQQLTEGVIWLTFSREAPLLDTVMTHVYSFFSHVLWPVSVPVAVLLVEPPGWRRTTLATSTGWCGCSASSRCCPSPRSTTFMPPGSSRSGASSRPF